MKPLRSDATRTQRVVAGRRCIALASLALGGAGFLALLGWSGITAFERDTQPVALAATDRPIPRGSDADLGSRPAPVIVPEVTSPRFEVVTLDNEAVRIDASPRIAEKTTAIEPVPASSPAPRADAPSTRSLASLPGVKFDRYGKVIFVDGQPWTGEVFDHRPIRPVRRQTMRTTAYSPDERSCGKWADGITASGKSVWMNGGRLAAADPRVPYGTILTVPGYNHGKPVQVWDRGGKIKGNRLDLLYPTHEIALQWGVQDLPVVFWEFVETD